MLSKIYSLHKMYICSSRLSSWLVCLIYETFFIVYLKSHVIYLSFQSLKCTKDTYFWPNKEIQSLCSLIINFFTCSLRQWVESFYAESNGFFFTFFVTIVKDLYTNKVNLPNIKRITRLGRS